MAHRSPRSAETSLGSVFVEPVQADERPSPGPTARVSGQGEMQPLGVALGLQTERGDDHAAPGDRVEPEAWGFPAETKVLNPAWTPPPRGRPSASRGSVAHGVVRIIG
jgi:hypothetical protein